MKKGLLILLASATLLRVSAQIPYELNWTREAILMGASGILMVNMALTDPDKTTMTEEEINGLDPEDVISFDRGATDNWSEEAALASDVGMIAPSVASLALPLAMPAISPSESYWKDATILGVIWLEANLLNLGGTMLVKTTTRRVRPYMYNEEVPLDEKLDADARQSFFSGHTSISAVNSFYLAKVFADYYPDSPWKPLTWGLLPLFRPSPD
jgi:hypothetical protein